MGKFIKHTIKGMSLLQKARPVLIFTLLVTVFMWCKPDPAAAAITTTVTPASAIGTTAAASANVTIPLSVAGNKRMLVVGITLEGATASTATNATVNCTYGGTALTIVPGSNNSGTSALEHTYLFYMLDNTTLMNNTARALTFTVNGFAMTGNSMHYAVYDGVAQAAPTGSTNNGGITDATTISLVSPLNIASGDTGFVVAMTSRSGSTTARTYTTPTNWTSVATATANATAPATNRYCYTSTTVNPAASVALTASGLSRLSLSGMVIKMADTTPPVANNDVKVNPDYNKTNTGPSATITATFTESDYGSVVTGCEYTTNGSTWAAGVVSGSSPLFTCTATPTGLSGALTINMRATSTGGGPTASTAITRTVDNVAPTDGSLTVSAGYLENSLMWAAATDATTGINHYDVRYAIGSTPANCSSGTVIYTGTGRNFTHTGLTTGQLYGYRVCATDNVNNVSPGATGTGTPVTRPSVVNSCGGCHGYPRTSNPFNDAPTTRNTPVGQFLGSHATHAGSNAGQYAFDCTKCHVSNATTAHANGTIELANPINANAGAKYGKGTSWTSTNAPTQFRNCTATYCHSNGTSVATGVIYTNISSPRWGKTTGCNVCHGTEAGTNGLPGYPNFKNLSTAVPVSTGWTIPGNALRQDNQYANYNGITQQPLVLSGFSLVNAGLTAGKTVTGITVAIKGSAASGQLNVSLTRTNNATAVGTAKTVTLPITDGEVVVNATPTDLWGYAWTLADLQSNNFGVIIKDNDTTASNINIDCVKVIIHTTDAPKLNSHAKHSSKTCDTCHYAVTTNGTSIADTSLHNAGSYSLQASPSQAFIYTFNAVASTCSNVSCHANVIWGVSNLGCIDCHSNPILRTQGRPGTYLADAVSEFGLAYGHKKSGRGAVSNDDCIVCHLEGNGTTHKPSAKHMDGNIDLRDPKVAGETPITNLTGGVFTFQRFSTSYATGSRSSTGHTNNADIAQVITIKFCAACHSSTGATNPTARSNNGGTGTATMPFGGINLGANYTVLKGAAVAGGLIDVTTQFATANSSVHPVLGPKNKDFPTPARMNAPYNNFTRVGTSGTKTLGVVINCFDCHNNNTGTLLTLRTISAHGTGNTAQVRGTFYVSAPTLCAACHTGYTSDTQHLAGSAMQTNGNGGEGMATLCQNCHGSQNGAAPARPVPAADYHGYNARLDGTNWPTGGGKPYGFIRNTTNFAGTGYHRPFRGIGELTTGSATCNGGSGCAGNGSARIYTPGGSY